MERTRSDEYYLDRMTGQSYILYGDGSAGYVNVGEAIIEYPKPSRVPGKPRMMRYSDELYTEEMLKMQTGS